MTPGDWLADLRSTLTYRLILALVELFVGPGSWHGADARRFEREAAREVRAAQRALADAIAEAVTETIRERFPGERVRPITLRDRDVMDLRLGPTTEQVYGRSFRDVWESLREGDQLADAVDKAQKRVQQQAATDLQLTYSHAHQQAFRQQPESRRPTYWTREPQGAYTCALCLIASTQRYTVGTLNKMHPNCDCRVVAHHDRDPGHVIDRKLLERVHAAVEAEFGFSERSGRGRIDYRQLLIYEDHGELGQVVSRRQAKKTLDALRGEQSPLADAA